MSFVMMLKLLCIERISVELCVTWHEGGERAYECGEGGRGLEE
jgi:hypothetical protein